MPWQSQVTRKFFAPLEHDGRDKIFAPLSSWAGGEGSRRKDTVLFIDLKATFPKLKYIDVSGLCKVATLAEIEAQGWSLNPGRYVGVANRAEDDFIFAERLEELNEELEVLNSEASELEERIANNVAKLLEEAI